MSLAGNTVIIGPGDGQIRFMASNVPKMLLRP